MQFLGKGRSRIVATAAVILLACGIGVAVAASSSSPPSNARAAGRGINEFGLTKGYLKGHTVEFRYDKGFFCDRHVRSTASSKCEAGKRWKRPPSEDFDPLYITIPLGFTVTPMRMHCPDHLACVDHPGTIDLRRLQPALAPLYPNLTPQQLHMALKNFPVSGHQHFITTAAASEQEWWDVRIVGVPSRQEWRKLNQHKSATYLLHEVKRGNTTGVIPSNIFLFFGVR